MENVFKDKKIGIWGLGAVGKSVLCFISPLKCSITALDQRILNKAEFALLEEHKAHFIDQNLLQHFLEMNDFIIPSPGVNLNPYQEFKKKWLAELDIFARFIRKPVIAVTGSVGKTTVTHILTQLLNKSGKKAIAAGNIGTPMLDILTVQDHYDIIVLELSSFQLQYSKIFQADLALLTTLYPNHLDHHATIEEYIQAKGNLFAHQRNDQTAIIPLEYAEIFWPYVGKQKTIWLASEIYGDIMRKLSDVTCVKNWQLILSALEFFDIKPESVITQIKDLSLLEHRMEYLGIYKEVRFYNDSKSTIPESTINAVLQCSIPPILFLGGLSKGVDRSHLIKKLCDKVKQIVCFGKEAHQLAQMCEETGIPNSTHSTLEDAFQHVVKIMAKNDIVLFSPSGSSFDLFKNYEERGKTFKQLFLSLT